MKQDRDVARNRALLLALAAGGAVAAVVALRAARTSDAPAPETSGAGEAGARESVAVASASAFEPGARAGGEDGAGGDGARGPTLLSWGKGPGHIGRPSAEEGHGETPLRLAVSADGTAYLLDPENGRIVRVLPDGGAGEDVRLPVREPLDLAVGKDGSLALLSGKDGKDGKVTLAGPDGRARAELALPEDMARAARSVAVRGSDVYVETRNGEHRRVGNVSGGVDPGMPLAPGAPTRDGRAFVTAILPSPDSPDVHVFVIDGATRAQRWSRLVRPAVAVEGIQLADTDASGDVYLIVTGEPRGGGGGGAEGAGAEGALAAQLLCLDGERGDVVGAMALPVKLGPENIVDAKALERGGVVFTVASKAGLRVERHDCPR